MRPVVAILSARPETIGDDYRRLFELAGIPDPVGTEIPLIAAETRSAGYESGQVCPPWQLEAMLKVLAGDSASEGAGPLLLPVTNSGPTSLSRGYGWDDILERFNQRVMDNATMTPAPFRPASLLPALEGVMPQGFSISPHLRGKRLFLLSALSVGAGGSLGANVALLASLLAAERKAGSKIPLVEIMTEVVGLAREVFPSLTVVTDATVVSVVRRGGIRVPLVRNLLIAGNDPVAVDSVLIRMAGLEPADSAWLRLCQARGFGVTDLAEMRIVGETKWLDLDFRIPEDTFASGNPVTKWSPGSLFNRMAGQSDGGSAPVRDSTWYRLFRDYQSGVTS